MKRFVLSVFLFVFCDIAYAQSEIGPEGKNLLWLLLILPVFGALYFVLRGIGKKSKSGESTFFVRKKVKIELEKDRLYYPDYLKLTVKNIGNTDIDMDRPLMVFDNFWLKRKFKLNGMENKQLYPLYLEKGKIHELDIDLFRFYSHDKGLKKYPKVSILVSEVNGKRLGSRAIFLRKTLFKF